MLLTQRQKEVLTLIASGYRTARIAGELDIKSETVNAHTVEIRRRLGARTNAQAVAIAKDLGIL